MEIGISQAAEQGVHEAQYFYAATSGSSRAGNTMQLHKVGEAKKVSV